MSEFNWRDIQVNVTDREAFHRVKAETMRTLAEENGYSFTEKWRYSDAYGIGGKTHCIYIPTSAIADYASVMADNVTELARHCNVSQLVILEQVWNMQQGAA